MVTRRLTGEQMTVMEVKGQGTCCFADRASEINLVQLHGDKLYVEASNLLATDAGLRTGTTFTGLRGATQGNGLFTTTVEGTGQAAIMSDGPAVVLRVSPQYPLSVDPGAYIAHQGNLRQPFQSGVTLPHLHGRGLRRGLPDPLRGRRPGLRAAQRAQHDRGGCLTCRSARSTPRWSRRRWCPASGCYSQRGAMLAYRGEVSFTPEHPGRPGRRDVHDRPPASRTRPPR